MRKKSSIEYLVNIVQSCIPPNYIPIEIIQQAKQMHKKEIQEAYAMGYEHYPLYQIENQDNENAIRKTPVMYYNETFNNLTPNTNNNEKTI